MPSHYQSLLVVMLVTGIGWIAARSAFEPLMLDADDFRRRRNLWLVISAAAFIMPGFWAYAAILVACLLYMQRVDSSPAALFPLLLVIVPPLEATIPGVFGVHHQRLLILVLLLPMVPRLLMNKSLPGILRLPTDKLLMAYLVLQVFLYWPYLPLIPALRFTILLLVNTWLPYFVMSRAFDSRAQLRDAIACFALCMLVLAPLAAAETRLASVLYSDFSDNWGIDGLFSYLKRGQTLRAQLASGQAIVLGYQFAIAIALWLYLQRHIASRWWRIGGFCLLVVGLVLPLSRGPWVGASAVIAAYLVITPGALKGAFKWSPLVIAAAGVLLVTPWGDNLVGYLPFVGDADQESIDYRKQIVDTSWLMIQQSPFFGSPFAKAQLESLRTGEGIIDIVNVYIAFALAYGIVGVAIFVSIFLSVLIPLLRWALRSGAGEEARHMSAGLFAALAGVMVMIAAVSNYLTVPYIYLMLIGFAVACIRVSEREQAGAVVRAAQPRVYRGGARTVP